MRLTTLAIAPALLAATAAFAQAPARQAPPAGDAPKPFTLPTPESFTLPNGLGVTLVPYGTVSGHARLPEGIHDARAQGAISMSMA